MTQSAVNNAKYEVESAIFDAFADCLRDKCNSYQSNIVEYISPQELLSYLPTSIGSKINRNLHIIKHNSGQWEISVKGVIRCYFGFQLQTRDPETIALIKDLVRKNSEKYRYKNDGYSGRKELGVCDVCYESKKIDPRFKRHICRVSGYFKCFGYSCNGRTFKVNGICLLDPKTLEPPTDYRCASCGYPATFTGSELREHNTQKNNQSSGHRQDLCQACDIWTNCQLKYVQPSAIFEALWDNYGTNSKWTINENGGVCCSFLMREEDDDGYEYTRPYRFDINPYVYCQYINTTKFYNYGQTFFSPNQNTHKHSTRYKYSNKRYRSQNRQSNELYTKQRFRHNSKGNKKRNITKQKSKVNKKRSKYYQT